MDFARLGIRLGAASLLLAMSCSGGSSGCGGGGCGGCGDGSYTFPADDPARPDAILQDETVRARITQDFLDFIRPQLPVIIQAALAGGAGVTIDADNVLHIPIPNTDLFDIGVAEARLRDGEALIWLDDLENRLDIRFEEPNNVRITMTNLRLGVMLDLREDVLGTTSSCPIEGELGPLGPGPLRHAAEISIDATIDPGVGPRPDYNLDIQVSVGGVSLNDLDVGVGDYCAEPECQDCVLDDPFGSGCLDPGGRCAECHVFCGGLTDGLLSLVTALIDLIGPLLDNILQPVIEGALVDALNGFNGNSAKIETQLSLADLAGLAALQGSNPVGVLVAPEEGRFPVLDRGTGLGMELTLDGGAEGELADCIGDLDDFVVTKGPIPELLGTDGMGRPYHVGATLSSSFLNQILYAVHRSGSLCLKLGSADVRELTGGAFTLNASLLSILASDLSKLADDTAPVIIELRPRNPGFVELGSGEVVGQDAMGNDVYDWMIKLSLQELGVAFHVLVHDRYVRVFEVTTDIFVGLNVNILPDNALEIAVGELRIDSFEEQFNELFPNSDFGEVLPTLLDLALGAFLNDALVFDVDLTNALSDALGGAPIFMRVNEIFRDGIQEDYLTLTMTFTSSQSGNLSLAAQTEARLAEDDGLHEQIDDRKRATGRIRMHVGESLPYSLQQELEYQVRVDAGLWRVARHARPDGTLFIEDPKLKMPGKHLVEVRARFDGLYETLDPTPAKLEVIVDPNPPRIAAEIGDEAVLARIDDAQTQDAKTLQLFARLDGYDWMEVPTRAMSPTSAHGAIDIHSLAGADEIELKARDGRGNESKIVKLRLGLSAAGERGGEAGCACHELPGTPHSHSEWPTVVAVMALAGLLLRRRRN